MKFWRLWVILFFTFCLHFAWGQSAPQSIAEYQGASLSKQNGIYIINVHGSFEEMGQQYGYLLKPQLNVLYQAYQHHLKLNGVLRHFLLWLREKQLPQQEKDFLQGMSETSGLKISQLMLLDHSIQMIYVAEEADKIGLGCSVICASSHYTFNGEMIIGRNFDWNKDFYSMLAPYLTVAVFHPNQGNAFATLGYVGASLSAVTAMNDKGLFIELNSGIASVGPYIRFWRASYFAQMMQMMQFSNNFEELEHALLTTPPDEAYMVTIADSQKAATVEMTTAPFVKPFAKIRTGVTPTVYVQDVPRPDLLVTTNTFRLKGWKNTLFSDAYPLVSTTQSFERYDHLQNWAAQWKGHITPELMQTILTMPIHQGGVAQTVKATITANNYYTYYSLIVLPAQMQWQIYGADSHMPWTVINLADYF